MVTLGKSSALILILIMTTTSISLMMVKPACAQTAPPSDGIPTPSVPTFTLKYIQSSYEEIVTDPYTGVNTTQEANNSTIDVIIRNQQFTPYVDEQTNTNISLYYNVQVKGHFEQEWTTLYQLGDDVYPGNLAKPSNSEYTIISTPQYAYSAPSGGQVDFQVEAIIGAWQPLANTPFGSFHYETSSWSPTQTITVPATIPLSPTPAPTSSISAQTPTLTSKSASSAFYAFLLLIALVVIAFLLAIIIFLLLYVRKQKPISSTKSNQAAS